MFIPITPSFSPLYHSPAISRLVCGLHHLLFVKFSDDAKNVAKQVGYHLGNLPDLIHLETDGCLATTDVGGEATTDGIHEFCGRCPLGNWERNLFQARKLTASRYILDMIKPPFEPGIQEPVSSFAALTRSMHDHPSLSSLTHLNLVDHELIEVGSDNESSAHETVKLQSFGSRRFMPLFSFSRGSQ
jgi:hypothetical protein